MGNMTIIITVKAVGQEERHEKEYEYWEIFPAAAGVHCTVGRSWIFSAVGCPDVFLLKPPS